MATPNRCMLQTAFKQLKDRGDLEGIDRLAALVNDHTISTRAAAAEARANLDVILTHNTFTSHRNNTCTACLRAQAAVDKAAKGDDKTAKKARKVQSKQAASDLDPQVVLAAAEAGADVHQVDPTYPEEALAPGSKTRMAQDEDGNVTIKDLPLYQPLTMDDDLSPLLLHFGLNPDEYEVIKGSFSCWMQSASDGAGGRDVTYLYAARFRKVSRVDPDMSNKDALKKWRSVLLKPIKPAKPTYKKSAGPVGTYALWPSDLQMGKTRTIEAVENFRHGIVSGLDEASRLLDAGEPIEALHIGWGGDETEGVCNNYKNQPYTVELNQSEQLELDFDLRVWALKEALQLGLPVSASSVVSNHGEATRNGGKDPETDKHDNSSTHVARQVKKLFAELERFDNRLHIDWTIGAHRDAHPGLVVNLSGELVYTSHGHIEKGRGGSTELRTKNAIENQLLGDIMAERRLIDVRLFVMAHYHHYYTIEDRGRVIMGLPALEAERSSEYMASQFGVWSPPGMLGMLIGKYDHRPYRHLNVFGTKVDRVPTLRSGIAERALSVIA